MSRPSSRPNQYKRIMAHRAARQAANEQFIDRTNAMALWRLYVTVTVFRNQPPPAWLIYAALSKYPRLNPIAALDHIAETAGETQ